MTAAEAEDRLGLTSADDAEIRHHLERLYDGVFTPEAVENHLREWVGRSAADWALGIVAPLVPAGGRILDVGCGYGSFVLLARAAGYDAYGFDLAEFEVDMARKRLVRLFPTLDAHTVFRTANALQFDQHIEGYDAITLWNVLEHVPDHRALLRDSVKLLKPGGRVFLICPNYLAWRLEAHYHVPWSPGLRLNRAWGRNRLIKHGKNPRYFDENIFYTTNWSVLFTLWRLRLRVFNIDGTLPLVPRGWPLTLWMRHVGKIVAFLNPFAQSATLMAEKPGGP